MAAPALELRAAIAADLAANVGNFGVSFTAGHGYLPQYDLEDLSTVRVIATVAASSRNKHTRTTHVGEIVIALGILKRLTNTAGTRSTDTGETLTELDQLLQLMRDIETRYLPDDPDDAPYLETAAGYAFQAIAAESDPMYDHDLLRNSKQFVGVLNLTFDVHL